MTSISPHETPELPQVPVEIVDDLQETLETELHQIVTLLPEVRSAIEAQWADGTKHASFAFAYGSPLNAHAMKAASVLKQWMEMDYGEGMVDISINRWSRPSDYTDEIVAFNNLAVRTARLEAGAVDISESALKTAANHIIEIKDQAIDDQDYAKAAEWRDQQKDINRALGGLGLAQPDA